MKLNKGSTVSWVVIIIVVVLVIIGLWWWIDANRTPAADSTSGVSMANEATTTPTQSVVVTTRSSDSVDAVIASLSDAGDFQSLWNSTGVSGLVTGKGPYTVFVPTNEAFAALAPGTIANMTAAQVKRLVEYHVVSGRALNVDAVSSGTINALSKDSLNFQANPSSESAQVDNAWALEEYKASNGVVYVISSVLLPPVQTIP